MNKWIVTEKNDNYLLRGWVHSESASFEPEEDPRREADEPKINVEPTHQTDATSLFHPA